MIVPIRIASSTLRIASPMNSVLVVILLMPISRLASVVLNPATIRSTSFIVSLLLPSIWRMMLNTTAFLNPLAADIEVDGAWSSMVRAISARAIDSRARQGYPEKGNIIDAHGFLVQGDHVLSAIVADEAQKLDGVLFLEETDDRIDGEAAGPDFFRIQDDPVFGVLWRPNFDVINALDRKQHGAELIDDGLGETVPRHGFRTDRVHRDGKPRRSGLYDVDGGFGGKSRFLSLPSGPERTGRRDWDRVPVEISVDLHRTDRGGGHHALHSLDGLDALLGGLGDAEQHLPDGRIAVFDGDLHPGKEHNWGTLPGCMPPDTT